MRDPLEADQPPMQIEKCSCSLLGEADTQTHTCRQTDGLVVKMIHPVVGLCFGNHDRAAAFT